MIVVRWRIIRKRGAAAPVPPADRLTGCLLA